MLLQLLTMYDPAARWRLEKERERELRFPSDNYSRPTEAGRTAWERSFGNAPAIGTPEYAELQRQSWRTDAD